MGAKCSKHPDAIGCPKHVNVGCEDPFAVGCLLHVDDPIAKLLHGLDDPKPPAHDIDDPKPPVHDIDKPKPPVDDPKGVPEHGCKYDEVYNTEVCNWDDMSVPTCPVPGKDVAMPPKCRPPRVKPAIIILL